MDFYGAMENFLNTERSSCVGYALKLINNKSSLRRNLIIRYSVFDIS